MSTAKIERWPPRPSLPYYLRMQTGSFAYNNGHIYYEVGGAGEPIVFIHGFTLDRRMWQPQINFFSQQYRIIAYDARGFGRSSVPHGPYNHHDDLRVLIEHLRLGRAHVVGLSMGGRIAVNLALHYPHLVRSLTLLDSALDGYPDTINWDVDARVAGLDTARLKWLQHELFAPAMCRPEVATALRAIVRDYSGWHWLHSNPQTPASTNARARLHEINLPTQVIVGEQDLPHFRSVAQCIATAVPGAQQTVIPGVGHMVNLEAAPEINALIAGFIESQK